jgi:hypothetical protein
MRLTLLAFPNLRQFVLYSSTLLLLNACGKNSEIASTPTPTPPIVQQPPAQKCTLVKSVYHINGLPVDSAELVYADSVLVRVNELKSGVYHTFEYSRGNIIKRNSFQNGAAQPASYTIIAYNAENMVTTLDFYAEGIKYRTFDFTYTAGKLNKVIDKRYGINPFPDIIENEYTFTYTGDNISRTTQVHHPFIDPETTISNYSYDTVANHLRKRTNPLIVEPWFFRLEGTLYPYYFSKNNISNIEINGNNSPHIFQINASGYLTEIIVKGKVVNKYVYECK